MVGRSLDKEVERFLKLLERFSFEQNLPQNFSGDAVETVHLAVRSGSHDYLKSNNYGVIICPRDQDFRISAETPRF